jgi:hypothetical protein
MMVCHLLVSAACSKATALLAKRLEAEHTRLQADHQLLLECCEGLQLLQLQNNGDREAAGAAAGYAAEELALLQQLQVCAFTEHVVKAGRQTHTMKHVAADAAL